MATLTPCRRLRRRRSSEAGAQLVEFAMVLPILMVLIAGIVDFGVLLQSYEVVTNAAREGARLAVLPGYGAGDVSARVDGYLGASGLIGHRDIALDPVNIQLGGLPAFPAAQVTVDYTHQFLFLGPMVDLMATLGMIEASAVGDLTFTATSTMRTETVGGN